MEDNNDKHWLQSFVEDHSLQLLVFLVSTAMALALIKANIDNLASRVTAIEIRQSEYPTEKWFLAKFDNLDEKIDTISERVDKVDNLQCYK